MKSNINVIRIVYFTTGHRENFALNFTFWPFFLQNNLLCGNHIEEFRIQLLITLFIVHSF